MVGRRRSLPLWLGIAFLLGCGSETGSKPAEHPPRRRAGSVTLSIVGTNDLHGAVDRLPILAGYIANLRAARAADGGDVLVLDAGDMFQGTLASNLAEGAPVIAAYNLIGYDAVAIGNHEFDFGPAGPAVTASGPEEDPRGALRARAGEAGFPMLLANVLARDTGQRPGWDNVLGSTLIEKAGVIVGVIGVTTEATPFTTMPANFVGLEMVAPALAIRTEAEALRRRGASVVVVAAHVGAKCSAFADPNDLSSCDPHQELFDVLQAVPAGSIDVVVAGHTHAGIAHRIAGVAVIESYASGRAFGRVDLRINPEGVVTGVTIDPPRALCGEAPDADLVAADTCQPGSYERRRVTPAVAVAAVVRSADEVARQAAERRLGVTLSTDIVRAYDSESALGNWFVDLMLAARPDADVAITNGGGLRADLPAGPLTYGALYRAMPFDNRLAVVKLRGRHLRSLISNNLYGRGGILSFAGVRIAARCQAGRLEVVIRDQRGAIIDDDRELTLLASDFLASGGDGLIGRLGLPDGSIEVTSALIRDVMIAELERRGGTVSDVQLFDPKQPRVAYPPPRPVVCAGAR